MNRTRKDIFKGDFALGIFCGFLLSLILGSLLSTFKTSLTQSEWLDFIPAFLAICVSLISIFIARNALSEQTLSRQAGTDPVVVAYARHREDNPGVIYMALANVGAGVAKNVTMTIENGLEDLSNWSQNNNGLWLDIDAFPKKVATIVQNSEYYFYIGDHMSLHNGGNPLPKFIVKTDFENIDGDKKTELSYIDTNEFNNMPLRTDPLKDMSTRIKDIAETLKSIKTGTPINAVTEVRNVKKTREAKERKALREKR